MFKTLCLLNSLDAPHCLQFAHIFVSQTLSNTYRVISNCHLNVRRVECCVHFGIVFPSIRSSFGPFTYNK